MAIPFAQGCQPMVGGGLCVRVVGLRLTVCCSLPSWIQHAPQSEQKARRSRLMTTVICADAHSGQRGTGHLLDG
jgi:hypothetical protein